MKKLILSIVMVFLTGNTFAADSLPSWNNTASKKSLMAFVKKVTDSGSKSYVPPSERIAVFDNDGTLWAEQPAYFQLAFAIDRVHQLADKNPQWKTQEPFASVLKGDFKSAMAGGEKAILELVMATHANTNTEDFSAVVKEWINTAKHPKTGRLYKNMRYQPMVEVLDYLRANGFKTFIVSGGGVDFMRVFAEEIYGVPAEQVIGSSIKVEFKIADGKPALMRIPEIDFIDDKAGKPVGIHRHIGRRPIAAFGNSDGDLQMLQWTCLVDQTRFCMIVHHTGAKGEWQYDRDSHIGKLDQALIEANKNGWTVVDMKKEWKTVYP